MDLGRFEGIWDDFKGFGVFFGVLEDLQSATIHPSGGELGALGAQCDPKATLYGPMGFGGGFGVN